MNSGHWKVGEQFGFPAYLALEAPLYPSSLPETESPGCSWQLPVPESRPSTLDPSLPKPGARTKLSWYSAAQDWGWVITACLCGKHGPITSRWQKARGLVPHLPRPPCLFPGCCQLHLSSTKAPLVPSCSGALVALLTVDEPPPHPGASPRVAVSRSGRARSCPQNRPCCSNSCVPLDWHSCGVPEERLQ